MRVVIYSLTFTPDANYIDFVRSEKNNPVNTFLYRMPALGGTPHLAMQGGIDFRIQLLSGWYRVRFLAVRVE